MKKSLGKVFVGLSGGVDSSVTALLLKNAGYDVTGVYIKGWQPDWIECTWKDDRISALRTAAHLEIPFVTLDLEKKYKEKVVEYLLSEYEKGNTPNGDMLCNREIKFGSFLRWAVDQGCDYVATGHYAQVLNNENDVGEKNFTMLEGADKQKDQSYFLSQLTQKELAKILFPIGHLQKKDVRDIALKNSLPVATRKDSQGICFVGDMEMKDFLKKELNPKKGKVLDEKGGVIGEHDGAILYTIGERHGFNIFKKSGENVFSKFFVIKKDIIKNEITVSSNEDLFAFAVEEISDEESKNVTIKNISFTNEFADLEKASLGESLSMRVRYRGEKYLVKLNHFDEENKNLKLSFLDQKLNIKKVSLAKGQFAVFYDGEKCLGGGEIS